MTKIIRIVDSDGKVWEGKDLGPSVDGATRLVAAIATMGVTEMTGAFEDHRVVEVNGKKHSGRVIK